MFLSEPKKQNRCPKTCTKVPPADALLETTFTTLNTVFGSADCMGKSEGIFLCQSTRKRLTGTKAGPASLPFPLPPTISLPSLLKGTLPAAEKERLLSCEATGRELQISKTIIK